MKCYKHQQAYAVGICKKCNKGICPACVIDSAAGIACKENCANSILRGIQRKGRKAFLFALLGIFYILLGFLWRDATIKAWHLFMGAGGAFLLISIETCYSRFKLNRKSPDGK
jgi:hypothetical protein